MGEVVFSDSIKRKKLENILHPRISKKRACKIKKIGKIEPGAIVIIEFPLLIELQMHKDMDKVILVYIPPKTQINRLMRREALNFDQACKRLSSQIPIDSKIKYAHYVINNEDSLKKTAQAVKTVFKSLRKEEEKNRQASNTVKIR